MSVSTITTSILPVNVSMEDGWTLYSNGLISIRNKILGNLRFATASTLAANTWYTVGIISPAPLIVVEVPWVNTSTGVFGGILKIDTQGEFKIYTAAQFSGTTGFGMAV